MARSLPAARQGDGGGSNARRRVIAASIVLGLLLLLLFTAFVLRLTEDAVRSEAEGRVRITAELNAQLVGEQSLRFADVAEAYAQRLQSVSAPELARLPADELDRVQRTLAALRAEERDVDVATFTDALGRVVASDPPGRPPAGTDLSGRDWYRGLRPGVDQYLSRADVTPGAVGAWTTLAVPVETSAGERRGVLTATAVNRFQGLADAASDDVELTLTDQDGVVVGRTRRPPRRLVTLAQDSAVAAALRGESGVVVRDLAGRPTVSGFAPVRATGWAVVADVPAARAFEDVTRLRVTLLAGVAVVAFLLLWLLPLLALRLGRARERIDVSDRFQADLLPSHLPEGVVTHYVASEKRMLLGGDFLDAIRTPDGGLAVLVGDVCGHGPRAAALAARLRASWRTLATAGNPLDRLDVLDSVVVSERHDEDLFATVAVAHVDAAGETLRWALAGHPPALLDVGDGVVTLDEEGRGPALGLVSGIPWPVASRELPEHWTLVLYTDGLIEARGLIDGRRLELRGLRALIDGAREESRVSPAALVRAVARIAEADGRGLDDDLALLIVDDAATRRQHADNAIHEVRRG